MQGLETRGALLIGNSLATRFVRTTGLKDFSWTHCQRCTRFFWSECPQGLAEISNIILILLFCYTNISSLETACDNSNKPKFADTSPGQVSVDLHYNLIMEYILRICINITEAVGYNLWQCIMHIHWVRLIRFFTKFACSVGLASIFVLYYFATTPSVEYNSCTAFPSASHLQTISADILFCQHCFECYKQVQACIFSGSHVICTTWWFLTNHIARIYRRGSLRRQTSRR